MAPATDDRFLHCPLCGTRYTPAAAAVWPRACDPCGHQVFRNPAPVGVVVQPIDDDGVLLVRRDIQPQKGWLSLPGGFLDVGETWQQGAARELWEETGVAVEADALSLFGVYSSADGTHLLVMALAPPLPGGRIPAFVANDEVSELVVHRRADGPIELAFPLHTQVLGQHFGWG